MQLCFVLQAKPVRICLPGLLQNEPGLSTSPRDVQPRAGSWKLVFLQEARRAVLELVDCLHHLVMPADLHSSSFLPEARVNPGWLRMLGVSGGKKGKTTLKLQIPLQGLALSPQHHDFLISFSSDTPCNTKLSTSASHLYGYQMNYTVFTGHKRAVLNWTGESRMQWGASATFPHAFFCKSKVFRQKNSRESFTFPRNNCFYIKETVLCAKAFSLLSSCSSMKWPFSRDFPGSSSLQGGSNVYMAMWLCEELKCSDV